MRINKAIAAIITAALAITINAPLANAADQDGLSETAPSYAIDGGISASATSKGPKVESKPAPVCKTNCTTTDNGTNAVAKPAQSMTALLWFDDPTLIFIPTPYGPSLGITYPALAKMARCTAPNADANFGYNGDAIPSAGTYNIKAWVTVNVYDDVNTINYYEQVVDPITGKISTQTVGTQEYTTQRMEYKYGCGTASALELQTRACVTAGSYHLDGPFDQNHNPMKPVTEGGTMTRTPNGDGVISWKGKTVEEISKLGSTMNAPKTGRPSNSDIFTHCIPAQNAVFDKSQTDSITDLGRYEAPTTLWASKVSYLHAAMSEADVAHIWKGTVARAKAASAYSYVNGIAYMLSNVPKAAALKPFASYYKVVCANGTAANKRSQFTVVNAKSYDGWMAQPWNDGGTDYYSWNCGANPTGKDEVRTNDLLACDKYGQAASTQTIVDHKVAAPLIKVDALVDGKTQELPFTAKNTVNIPSAADPIHATWEPVRINMLDGTDITKSSNARNTVWEYTYKLDETSSPILKNTGVNDRTQPYHGWVDNTADSVTASEMPLDRQWIPGMNYMYDMLPYSYTFKAYTYYTMSVYLPYTFHNETRQSGTETYTCGTYTYQCGSHQEARTRPDSGAATWYWWANSGRGGYACPAGWSLSGSTCYITTTYHVSVPNYCTGTNWCQRPAYVTVQVKNAPPAGFIDNGTQYQKDTVYKSGAPAGYIDNGTQYQMTNPAPAGYVDNGAGYTSKEQVNKSGKLGGVEFNTYRKWVTDAGLTDCTVDVGTYTSNGLGGNYAIKCGDNVTDNTRGAYFRFFMSTTAGRAGWTVTPWVKVTGDILANHTTVTGFTMDAAGVLTPTSTAVNNKWVRSSYECPAAPLTVNVERVVS